ncbi:MAG: hypothetical protein GY841_14005 [FCB group bacterium]|nr:hypothetical protein [FCB group bacterium]
MKKLSALILVLTLCCCWVYVPVIADEGETPDGDDGGWIQPINSSPPPDYVGPWPIPDGETTTSDDSNTVDGGDDGGWIQPNP